MNSVLSIVGLGHVGLPLAAALAAKGFQVIGVDSDGSKVEAINRAAAPIIEPGLEELLRATAGRFTATEDIESAVLESAVTFISVPTPTGPHGEYSLRNVRPVCDALGRALSRKEDFHLVVLASTVMPGATGNEVVPALEAHSEKRCGRDFGLCYSPLFFSLGNAIHEVHHPDFILIGESDPQSGDMLSGILSHLCDNDPPVARMNFVNAELTKVAVNTFVATKIAFANTLARICEKLPGADVDEVTSAAGLDSRIGPRSITGAISFGGPCFPRDNLAFMALARQVGAPGGLAEATDRANREEMDHLADLVKKNTPQGATVGILGLAYKPNTDVVEEAPGLLLAEALINDGIPVVAYDPAATDNARRALKGALQCVESMESCVQQADVLVVTTPWEAFRDLEGTLVQRHRRPLVLIDCWRLYDQVRFESNVEYVALGMGPGTTSMAAPRSLRKRTGTMA
jgi:UDPglucose 6-dehydrogenase